MLNSRLKLDRCEWNLIVRIWIPWNHFVFVSLTHLLQLWDIGTLRHVYWLPRSHNPKSQIFNYLAIYEIYNSFMQVWFHDSKSRKTCNISQHLYGEVQFLVTFLKLRSHKMWVISQYTTHPLIYIQFGWKSGKLIGCLINNNEWVDLWLYKQRLLIYSCTVQFVFFRIVYNSIRWVSVVYTVINV